MKLWLNGKIMNEDEAVIPASDHGFLYGMGLFETFRTYRGQPFLLKRHLDRLAEGCRELRITGFIPEETLLRQAIADLLEAVALNDAYFRLSVSAGSAPLGLPGVGGYPHPNVLIHVKELPRLPEDPKQRLRSLMLLSLRRSTPEGIVRRKSFHYMNSILGKWEQLSRPGALQSEGLFLNERGFITEGTVSNVFFIRDNVLKTPSVETGCLPGVTRAFVMELAKEAGMRVEEGCYKWEELLEAEEAFYTNSIQEIVPVGTLIDESGQSMQVGDGIPGHYTLKLIGEYRKYCENVSEESGAAN
jgi:4-amino-4-deoxychorismate lyase